MLMKSGIYANIIDKLQNEGNPNSKQMAELMENRLKNHI